jgi:hypothetical protein
MNAQTNAANRLAYHKTCLDRAMADYKAGRCTNAAVSEALENYRMSAKAARFLSMAA